MALEFMPQEDVLIEASAQKEIQGSLDLATNDRSTEPYICGHNMLLSHAKAVTTFRKNYQNLPANSFPYANEYSSDEPGRIGITLNGDWAEPYTNSTDDVAAAESKCYFIKLKIPGHLEFQMSWFADPIWFGDYPDSMKDLVGNRLPTFTSKFSYDLKI